MKIVKHDKYEVKTIDSDLEYTLYVETQNKRSTGNINHSRFITDLYAYGHKLNYDDTIIDVGCRGNAQVLLDLINLGYKNVYGIDIGYDAEQMWQNLNMPIQQKLKRHDIHDGLGFDIKFDVITSSHTLEHCYNPEKVIKTFYDGLKTSGILHLQIPLSKYDEYLRHTPHYAYWETKDNFISWLYDLGFEMVFSEKRNTLDDLCVICKKII